MAEIKVPLKLPATDVNFTFGLPSGVVPHKPFPDSVLANGPISLAAVSAKADKDFKIGDSDKSISFGIGADGMAALGVYRKTADLLRDLKAEGFDEAIANLKNWSIPATDNLLALRWGYGLEANAKGQIALGTGGGITFGGDARRKGVSAVLHARPQSENAAESIAGALKAWRVPQQVKTVDDIQPKTSIITETTGQLNLSLGMQYGYSYNWVKEGLAIGGLQGDLGLKIEAGISARLGFSASGRYALAITRESSKRQLRVQIFRLRQRGWSFAFKAGVSSQFKKTPLPKSFDEFIKGVFNLHGVQVIKDIETWLDTDKDLAELLGEAAKKYGREMFKDITGFDPIDKAQEFTDQLRGFIDKWNELPAEASSLVYKWVDENTPVDDLRDFLTKIVQSANSSQSLAKEITSRVGKLDFFDNEIGKWLTAVADKEIVSLLANIDEERASLVKYANTTLGFLKQGELNGALTKLQKWVNEKIGLEKLEKALPKDIDAWLTKRLVDFLGELNVVKELEKIREAIAKIRDQWDTFYRKGYDALMQKYNLDLNYSYQSSTTRDALIDLSIDFSKPNADSYLAEAISGNFNRLLADPLDGVTLHSAFLTHGIKRRSHLELDSPFYKMGLDQINESMASAKGVDNEDGRLWVFNLKSVDIKRRRKTLSKLSITAQLTTAADSVRVFDNEAYQSNYKYMLAEKRASTKFVERRLELGVNTYLGDQFPAGNLFSDYLIEIDKALDKHHVDGVGNFIATLDVSVPGRVLAAYKNLPRDFKSSFYKDMSARVQSFLRDMVPLGFVFESGVFKKRHMMYPLLAYSALPIFMPSQPISEGVFYWNYQDDELRRNTVLSSASKDSMKKLLKNYEPEIPEEFGRDYEASDVDLIAWKCAGPRMSHAQEVVNLLNLCDLEVSIMRGVVKSARLLHTFLDSNDREEQIRALSLFGSEFTETFNQDLGGDFAGKSFRPMGSLLILEIAKLLDPGLNDVKPTAMLETMVAKPEFAFDSGKILDGTLPSEEDLLLHQRILTA